MYTPETDIYCKNCIGHCYDLSCKGCEHCGIRADIKGTLESLERDCRKAFRVETESTSKINAAFDSAARAYNRGEGFIQWSPILGFSCFTYEGHDWNLEAVSQRAYEIR